MLKEEQSHNDRRTVDNVCYVGTDLSNRDHIVVEIEKLRGQLVYE